jgi:phage shock protein C
MTQPNATPYKQLRRPLDDRILAGVCSGVGRYLGVDPVLIRIGFAVLAILTWGTALLAYPVMWFIMPDEPAPAPGFGSSAPSDGPGAGNGTTPPVWREPTDPTWGQPPTSAPSA